ncbi:MAG: type II secretion system protein F [Candidatus Tectimicrobiota bacterium]|nr:MAG: type II secretion system protein F [Candidatus Tectomicrobia bacterium]
MPVFKYTGKTRTGQIQKGEIEANDRQTAIALLRQRQILVTSIRPKAKDIEIRIPGLSGKVKEKDLVVFTRQLATMIDAGLPLVQCLDILQRQATNKEFSNVIAKVKTDVEAGETFSDALRKHPKVFSEFYTNMVEAGETGGVLDTILARLSTYLEKAKALKGKVKGALVYPAAVIGIAVIVIIFLMIYVIPVFAEMFADFGASLPALTVLVMRMSDLTRAYIVYAVPAVILLIFLFKRFYRTAKGQRLVDGLLLQLPVFGPLLQKVAVAKFARTLGTLVSSGVPIIDSLQITARTAGNKVVEEAVLATISSIKEGQTIAEPLGRQGVFPPMVTQMIEVGENAGALDMMLHKVADFYEDEVDTAVEALTSLLEPALMVFLGTTIGFMVVAMYLPIFKLAGAVEGG